MTAAVPDVPPAPVAWAEARRRAYAAAPLPARSRPLDHAAGAVLAEPLHALVDLPGADTAAMDGYAVAGPGPWRLRGRLLAGPVAQPLSTLDSGLAVEIATGAPVPPGAETVLPYEESTVERGVVSGVVEAGRHIRRAGEECRRGDEVLEAGCVLTALTLGLAAATGHDEVRVHVRPRVRVLVAGDEVVRSGVPGPGQVRDAVGPMLPGLVRAAGGDVTGTAAVADRRGELSGAVQAADGDVVVTSGSSAAGPADHLRPVLAGLGATVLVDGVACRPGHPQLLARLPDGRYVVGLPGNPLAAVAGALTVLAPLLAALGGRPYPQPRPGVAGEALRARPDDTRLVPVALVAGRAVLVGPSGPAMLRGAARGRALAVVPPGRPVAAGDPVELLPLPD